MVECLLVFVEDKLENCGVFVVGIFVGGVTSACWDEKRSQS